MAIVAGLFRELWRDRSGVTAVEYGLIIALVALGIVGSLTALGRNLSTVFSKASVGI